MEELKKQVKAAKKIFTPHKELLVRVKENAQNPLGQYMFDFFLLVKDIRPTYKLYIHTQNGYATFSAPDEQHKLEPARIRIDDGLWIELLNIFEVVPAKEKKD